MSRRKRPLDEETNPMMKPCAPKYAILRLKSDEDCLQMFQFALSRGIVDISFVSHPREFFNLVDGGLKPNEEDDEKKFSLLAPSRSPQQLLLEQRLQASPSVPETSTALATSEESEMTSQPLPLPNPQLLTAVQQQHLNNVFTAMLAAQNALVPSSTASNLLTTSAPTPAPTSSLLPPQLAASPTFVPSSEIMSCRLCNTNVSCKKISNLTSHCLKYHMTSSLWQCPEEGCPFADSDYNKTKTHMRTSHGSEGTPKDNRTKETTLTTQILLTQCFPNINWVQNYSPETAENKFAGEENSLVNWASFIPPQSEFTNIECAACNLKVSLNKRSVEEHINMLHVYERPYQCGLCTYANVEEWKVRMHATLKHPETPFVNFLRPQSSLKPHLFIAELFPELKAFLPEDEIDKAVRTFNTPVSTALAFLRSSATPDSAVSNPEHAAQLDGAEQPEPPVEIKPIDVVSLSAPSMASSPIDVVGGAATPPMTHEPTPPTLTAEVFTGNGNSLENLKPATDLPAAEMEKFIATLLAVQSSLPPSNATSLNSGVILHPPMKKRRTRQNDDVERVSCEVCQNKVDSKRTTLISHAKTHCQQRQWQCPFCESSASFHSKLKLHIANAHKNDAEPLDLYSPELENQWLVMFRTCFPTYAEQCFKEDWKFRSKQQQSSGLDDSSVVYMNSVANEGAEMPKRALLLEGLITPSNSPHLNVLPQRMPTV
ncbi:unnamed protein product [Caenorhabditis auriculariae]|uniref:C2H2-type domain-containing protein n=1 Tax=Caenorhabditis auriculariae TaxID=2777116 RepID=A0A8S1HLN9_9PELO|nr:unnamed protein product [Caenorhabditis auriculariae]